MANSMDSKGTLGRALNCGHAFRSGCGPATGIFLLAVVAASTRMRADPVGHEPLPRVLEVGRSEHVALSGFSELQSRTNLRPGDSVTALFTLSRNAQLKQWLVETTAVEPTPEEAKLHPSDMSIYVGNGHKVRFDAAQYAALRIRVFGPFVAGGDPKPALEEESRAESRIVVRPDFLALGLSRMFRRAEQFSAEGKNPFPLSFLSSGLFISEGQKSYESKLTAEYGISTNDERIYAGSGPALLEFYSAAKKVPAIARMLDEVVDSPPVGSFFQLTKLGTSINYQREGLGKAERIGGLPDLEVIKAPFSMYLNGWLALNGEFYVADAIPPLMVSAGIIELVARPTGSPPRFFDMRILAARSESDKAGVGGLHAP
jgi:hypothetical protein